MKDMNEIDKILEKKYKEIKVPDKMFDTTKLFKRIAEEKRRRKRVVRVASIILVLFFVSATIIGINFMRSDGDKIEKNVDNITSSENNTVEQEIVGNVEFKVSQILYKYPKPEYISIIEIEEIEEYEIIDGVPSTRVRAKVLKNYLNDIEGDVEMIIPGGKFIVKEIKNLLGIKDKENNISIYKDDDYVQVTCDSDFYISEVKPNKEYVTTSYEKDGILYICSDLKYGFREYDEKNNTVKDFDDNEIVLDVENYLKGK